MNRIFTTGHFYGRANLLASWAVGFGNKATVTSYGIRNPCVWQKVSDSQPGV